MRTALAQMRVLPGKPEENFRTMEAMIAEAKASGCEAIAFPELCVGGYLLGDLWLDERWCADLESYDERLRELSGGIVLIYGNVYVDRAATNKDGRSRKYNAVRAFQDGKPLPHALAPGMDSYPLPDGVAPKTLLPNYRIFDDERYFYSLLELSTAIGEGLPRLLQPLVATIAGKPFPIGLEVCEDIWFKDYEYSREPMNVSKYLIRNGAKAIFNVSASPWTYGKDWARDNRLREAAQDAGDFVPLYYVNCVGTQNNGKNFVTFDGDSAVYSADARRALSSRAPFEAELLIHDGAGLYGDIAKDRGEAAAGGAPRRERSRIEWKYLAAREALRALDELFGNSRFPLVIGLSGGVDSSLVAALATLALGPGRVRAFNLPSRYNSDRTRNVARHVAKALGLRLDEIPIEPMVAANEEAIAFLEPSGLNKENIQAKIRGTSVLSNAAACLGGVMTNNGNKVEVALGYATLYGDVNGAIAPIGDLLKTEVFEMCRYLNDEVFKAEVIPQSLLPDQDYRFEIAPSAELKSDQVDPMKWGYHDALLSAFTDYKRLSAEEALELYLHGELATRLDIPESLLARYGLDLAPAFVADLEWFADSLQRAVFKRVQAPPIVIMSKGAYGFDIRESQLPAIRTRRYLELREAALKGAGR
jgi:NAD+ synthase (glutamine-hydrolysing)